MNAINIIAWISMSAIVIATTALVLVLSVYNGFEGLVKSLYSSFYTDLRISPVKGKTIILTPAQLSQLRKINGIKNFSTVIEEKAFLQNGDNQTVMYMKGVDENYRYVTGVADHIVKGEYDIGTGDHPELILGSGVEGALGIQADRNIFVIRIYLPRKSNTEQIDQLNDINVDTIRTSSTFLIQQDFDNKYGITNIDFARRALKFGDDEYSSVEITLRDPSATEKTRNDITKLLGPGYLVQTRYEQNQSLYGVLTVERWFIYGVLCLILVVAAFTMIGALTMLVLEKQKDIGVLHALGGNRGFIQRIFLSEGLLLALIGTVAGMILAIIIAVLQIKYHLIPLEGGSFLIDYFPVKLRAADFVLVGGTVFAIALIASWLPSRKAAMQEFSLRSE